MANNLSRNPWSLDTASASLFFTGDVFITEIVWTGIGSAGDTVSLLDSGGNEVFVRTAPSTEDVHTNLGTPFIAHGGLKLTVIDSGRLLIYLS